MTDLAIRVENVSKLYRLGETAERYNTLRDTIARTAAAPLRALRGKASGNGAAARRKAHEGDNLLWALRDVSFEVKRGEVLGIIGRNGAGKSTLLKVLSRITEPTEGAIDLYGRVASLLEVGTGFHPELTGRENIFLNGSILGMTHQDIKRKFDEIVAFAGVERFIDTPVKRYSSGMGVRLGFSVAAHLEPEILIIDEVLAVGDAEFQRKCLGKMEEVGSSGRTVLFVSHNMAAIQSLCTRTLLISSGCIEMAGTSAATIQHYLRSPHEPSATLDLLDYAPRRGRGDARIVAATLSDERGTRTCSFRMGTGVELDITIDAIESCTLRMGVAFFDKHGARVTSVLSTVTDNLAIRLRTRESVRARCKIKSLRLIPGEYRVNLALLGERGHVVDLLEGPTSITITESDIFGTGKIPDAPGVTYFDASWSVLDRVPESKTIEC